MDKLPTPAHPFGADTLACALTLTDSPYPTPAQLDAALLGIYPVGGPTAASLVAAGWLLPTIDKKGLRYPPLTPAEVDARLADYEREAKATLSEHPDRADSPPEAAGAAPLLSYYRGPITNTTPHATTTPAQLHRVLTNPPTYLRARADAARAEYAAHGKSPRYRELKNGLDYFTAGGTFAPTRADANLTVAAGLLTLDFDELAGRVAEARAALLADEALAPALVLLFVSPSGDGLKAVLAADPRHDRATNYARLGQHLTRRYGWGPTLDKKTADVSRACFLSHDPTAWLAPAYAPAA